MKTSMKSVFAAFAAVLGVSLTWADVPPAGTTDGALKEIGAAVYDRPDGKDWVEKGGRKIWQLPEGFTGLQGVRALPGGSVPTDVAAHWKTPQEFVVGGSNVEAVASTRVKVAAYFKASADGGDPSGSFFTEKPGDPACRLTLSAGALSAGLAERSWNLAIDTAALTNSHYQLVMGPGRPEGAASSENMYLQQWTSLPTGESKSSLLARFDSEMPAGATGKGLVLAGSLTGLDSWIECICLEDVGRSGGAPMEKTSALFVPCRSANSAIGLYDVVGRHFYPFSGPFDADVRPISYTVAYHDGLGRSAYATKVHGQNVTIRSDVFTRTGYTQTGWTVGGVEKGVSFEYADDASVSLTAIWAANTSTVTLDRQGGTGGSGSVTATYGTNMPKVTAPTKAGSFFRGYFDAKNGQGTQYYDNSGNSSHVWDQTGAKTLYAFWVARNNAVTTPYDARASRSAEVYSTDRFQISKTAWGDVAGGTNATISYTLNGSVDKQVLGSRSGAEPHEAVAWTPTVPGTYEFEHTPGAQAATFTVGKCMRPVVVTVRGRSKVCLYDGASHATDGFDVEILDPSGHYTTDCFNMTNVAAHVGGTTVAGYVMGLKAEQFENLDDNFTDVTFVVFDGELVIRKDANQIAIEGQFPGCVDVLAEADAAGAATNYIVRLTNDITGTLELPDAVTSATIDLNGHFFDGPDGADGDEGEAADGSPAVICAPGAKVLVTDSSAAERGSMTGGDGGSLSAYGSAPIVVTGGATAVFEDPFGLARWGKDGAPGDDLIKRSLPFANASLTDHSGLKFSTSPEDGNRFWVVEKDPALVPSGRTGACKTTMRSGNAGFGPSDSALAFKVDRGGTLAFKWRVDGAPSTVVGDERVWDGLKLYIDGEFYRGISGNTMPEFEDVVIELERGPHELSFVYEKRMAQSVADVYRTPDCAWLADFTWRDLPAASAPDIDLALNEPSPAAPLHFGTAGAWQLVAGEADDAVQTQDGIKPGDSLVITTKVVNAGTLSWTWKTGEIESGWRLTVDGLDCAASGTVAAWTNQELVVLGAGEHIVSFTFTSGGYGSYGMLDCVAFKAAADAEGDALADAVFAGDRTGCADLVWQRNATGDVALAYGEKWYAQRLVANSADGQAMRSGAVTADQQSVFSAKIGSGTGVLSFDWKVDSDSGTGAGMTCSIFDEEGNPETDDFIIVGQTDWETVRFQSDFDGEHTLVISYLAGPDATGDTEDAGWIDNVRWVPDLVVREELRERFGRELLLERFGADRIEIEYGAAGYSLRLLKPIADGPVVLPTDIGPVALYLNAFSIIGPDGVSADDPDGKPAIVIAGESGAGFGPTKLAITGNAVLKKAAVRGGKGFGGSEVVRAGDGAVAIDVASSDVEVTYDSNAVTVVGGDGGNGCIPGLACGNGIGSAGRPGWPIAYDRYAQVPWQKTGVTADGVITCRVFEAVSAPLALPDSLGNVVIDLAGHDIVGPNGTDGTVSSNGSPAIVIYPDTLTAATEPMELLFVDSTASEGDPTVIRGGDGGSGVTRGGDGGDAISFAAGVSVKAVHEGEGVRLIGGRGGAGTETGGNGGAGTVPGEGGEGGDESGAGKSGMRIVKDPTPGLETRFIYDGTEKRPFAGVFADGYTLEGPICATNPGSYNVSVKLVDNSRWEDGSSSDIPFDWSIDKSDESKALEAAFAGSTVELLDEDGVFGYKIRVEGSLSTPVEIPDNVGKLVVDLNGHSVTGLTGEASTVCPGGIGGDALRIVSAEGPGLGATKLVLENFGSKDRPLSEVCGGTGGVGVPGGAGGAGIRVVSDRPGVTVDVGINVIVIGGTGGVSAVPDIASGTGGAAIVGDVGLNGGLVVGGTGGEGAAGDPKGGVGGAGGEAIVGRGPVAGLGIVSAGAGGNGGTGILPGVGGAGEPEGLCGSSPLKWTHAGVTNGVDIYQFGWDENPDPILPKLVIPDNLGPIFVDLYGHEVAGEDGTNGTTFVQGGPGGDAIEIVTDPEWGLGPTVLTIADTTADADYPATVVGGNGGAGAPGGAGGAGIRDSSGRLGVTVSVASSVVVLGGEGGVKMGEGLKGDCGQGIVGLVDENRGEVYDGEGSYVFVGLPCLETSQFVYDGCEHTPFAAGEGYTFSRRISATDVGEYLELAVLKPGYKWSWGSLGPVVLRWSIVRAPVTEVLLSRSTVDYTGEALAPEIAGVTAGATTFAVADAKTLRVSYLRGGVATEDFVSPGEIEVRVSGLDNFEGSASASYVIEKGTLYPEQEIRAAFGPGAAVQLDTNGVWCVTLAEDVVGPVAVPASAAKIRVDLAGHSIVGTNGVTGADGAGTAGAPALVLADAAVEVRVVDGSAAGDGKLVGGNGGWGTVGAAGAPAVAGPGGEAASVAEGGEFLRPGLGGCSVRFAPAWTGYTGERQEPAVSVVGFDGTVLSTNEYAVSWDDDSMTNVGTYVCTATLTPACTNYAGSGSAQYEIRSFGTAGEYMVIDLAVPRTVTYERWNSQQEADDAYLNDACRGSKVVLRRIPANAKGYPVAPGSDDDGITSLLPVRDEYWMGIFEVTVGQYVSLIGGTPAAGENAAWPAAGVSYNKLRYGADIATEPSDPVADYGLLGLLAQSAGLTVGSFDLPTEAQWEIAARAGATGLYGAYCDADGNAVVVTNVTEVTNTANATSGLREVVGLRRPNLWGLYDMAGNCDELCRDAWSETWGMADAETPYEKSGDANRVVRGGNAATAVTCRPSFRTFRDMGGAGDALGGFRVCCLKPVPAAITALLDVLPDSFKCTVVDGTNVVVKFTEDLAGVQFEIPAGLGTVTFDLNGRTVSGPAGAAGGPVTDGSRGSWAFKVGEGTEIVVTDSAGDDGRVVGGEGGYGLVGGEGGYAFVDASGAALAVTDAQGLVRKGVDGRTIIDVPVQVDMPVYNGETQTVALSSADCRVIEGDKGLNATNYTVSVSPADGFCWADGTFGETNVEWQIARRQVTLESKSVQWRSAGEHSNDVVSVSGDGFVAGEGVTTFGFAVIDVEGEKANAFEWEYLPGTLAQNYDVTVKYGVLKIAGTSIVDGTDEPGGNTPADGVSRFDTVVTYDGLSHTIDQDALAATIMADAALAASGPSFGYALSADGPFGPMAPTIVDAGSLSVWYRVAAKDFATFVHEARVVVKAKEVTLTSADDTFPYDGAAHSNSTVTVGYPGFVAGEGVTASAFGTIADAGTAPNDFAYEFFENTKAENYLVTCVTGVLEVTASADPVRVTVTGHAATNVYNGVAKTVSGYDVAIEGSFYTADDFEFSGTASVSATPVGVHKMGLDASQFANLNVNYTNVVFDVTDGELVIVAGRQQAELETAFGPGAAVEPVADDDGVITNHLVKLTEDIAGPVVLPEDVSEVVVMLDGHSIVGADGADGSDVLPGEDGRSAVVVENGAANVLIVGPGSLAGGNGGDGSRPGLGADAVEADDGCSLKFEGEVAASRGADGAFVTASGLPIPYPGPADLFEVSESGDVAVVRITNDVDSAELPLLLPVNAGKVLIDLCGHTLRGADGAPGTSCTAGGDGCPAIRVVLRMREEDDRGPTRITLTNSSSVAAMMIGGDGAVGNPKGIGAIAVQDGDGNAFPVNDPRLILRYGKDGPTLVPPVDATTEFVYDATEKCPVAEPEGYALAGDVTATVVGGYEIVVTPAEGCLWDDLSVTPTNIAWKIVPAKLDPSEGPDGTYPAADVDPADAAAVADPTVPFSSFDTTNCYDGAAHTLDTNALAAAYANAFLGNVPSFSYALESNGVYGAEAPAFTDATVTSVWYKVTASNFEDVIHPAKVIVTNRCVTLTSADGTFVYDGQAHSNATATAEGFVGDDGVMTCGYPTVTDAGTVPNAFAYEFLPGTRPENYLAVCVTGVLTVTAQPVSDSIAMSPVGETYVYGGDAKEPKPAVSNLVLGAELVEGEDYDYAWADNVAASDAATVIANFKGNYSGAITNTFVIVPATFDPAKGPDGDYPTAGVDPADPAAVADPAVPFSSFDVTSVYDGAAHTVDAKVLAAAYANAFLGNVPSFGYALESNGVYGAEAPAFTDVTSTSFWYKVTVPNFVDVIHPVKVTVTNRCVTVTSGTESFVFDGQAHSNATVSAKGFVGDNGVTACGFPTITYVGERPNAFAYEFLPGTRPENYLVACVTGTVSVVPCMQQVTVKVTGHAATYAYTGTEKSAGGYEIAIDNPLYTTADIGFDGPTNVSATAVGTYAMGLFPTQFANLNPNFGNVVFKVIDGKLTIRENEELNRVADAFGGGAAVVAQTDDGETVTNWVVTVTNDVQGPVSLPEYVSNVVIRLEDCLIVGSKGKLGKTDKPGLDGSAAIVLGNLSANVEIVGRGSVLGGDGGAGNPPGKGAQAIVFADGSELNPTVSEGVTVAPGADGQTLVPYVDATTWFKYDGTEKRPVADTNIYVFAGDVCATNAGEYAVTVAPAAGRAWDDGTTQAYEIAWTVAKRDVLIESVGPQWRFTYDGTPHSNAVIKVGGDGFVEGEGVEAYGFATIVGAGEKENAFSYRFLDGTLAENYDVTVEYGVLKVVKGSIIDGTEEPGGDTPAGNASRFDTVAVYDGAAHTIDTDALVAAIMADELVATNSPVFAYAAAAEGPFGPEAPSIVDVGTTTFWYRVSADNFTNFVHAARVTVTNRCVTLTSASESFSYDGQAHSNTVVTAGGAGFVDGEGFATDGFPTITYVGSVPNGFDYVLLPGTKPENYLIECVKGTLEVTPCETPVTVKVTGHAATYLYTGFEKSVDGYEIAIDNPLYGESDFAFAGVAHAAGTAVGTYPMGLAEAQFENVNANFANIVFEVVDGTLTIGENKELNAISDAFGGNAEVVAQTDDGGNVTNWVVTVTNDVTGPVELPAYVADITIDLVGNSAIVGADGLTGAVDAPGRDGSAAIVVRNPSANVTIVGYGLVKGGNGGSGNPPGTGAFAVVTEGGSQLPAATSVDVTLAHGADGLTLIPYVEATTWFKYDGTEKRPVADTGAWTLAGAVSAKDAGEYTVRVAPAVGCAWSDGSTSTNDIEWTIAKREVTLKSIGPQWRFSFDGSVHSNAVVEISGDGFAEGEGVEAYDFATIVGAGERENTFRYRWLEGTLAANYDLNVEYGILRVVKGSIIDGTEEPGGDTPADAVSRFDAVAVYDGQAHTIGTDALVAAIMADELVATNNPVFAFAAAPEGPFGSEAPSIVDVGTTSFWYCVSAENYSSFIHAAQVTVTNRCVTLTSASESFTYDTLAHSNSTVTVGGAGFVGDEGVVTGGFPTITDVGSVPNAFDYEFLPGTKPENYLIECVKGTLTVKAASIDPEKGPDGDLPAKDVDPENPRVIEDPAVPFSSFDTTNVYDGAAHTLDTNALAAAYANAFLGNVPSFSYALAKDGPYAPDLPAFADVTVTSFWYKVTADNSESVIHPVKVIVTKRPVTLTSGTQKWKYDGLAHSNTTVTAKLTGGEPWASALPEGEGIATFGFSTVTEAGSVPNAFAYEFLPGTKPENYLVTCVTGTLTVAKVEGQVTVKVTGHGATYDYDTREKSVEGYDVEIDDPAGVYAEKDFAFSGTAHAAGTEVGTYGMGLAASQFKSLNANFESVLFEVVDGELVIVKGETQLKIENAFYGQASAKPELDVEGEATNWVATLTGDVTETVKLPADIGPLTVDLAGRTIRGTTGEAGTRTTPGAKGQPAVVVSSGTDMKVVDTVGGGMIAGGKGGDGNPPGEGGSAVVDSEGRPVESEDLKPFEREDEPGDYTVRKYRLYPHGDVGKYVSAAKGSVKYNGVLLDTNGCVAGTVQLTMKAPSKKTGNVDLSAKVVTLTDKQSYTFKTAKGGVLPPTNGVMTAELAGSNKKSLAFGLFRATLDGDSLTGSVIGPESDLLFEVDASLDRMGVKDRKAAAQAAVAPFVGTWSGRFVAEDGESFAAGFSATLKNTGKATVKVLDADGKTMSYSAVSEIGEGDVVAVPVLVRKTAKVNGVSVQRTFGFRIVFERDEDGNVLVEAADVSLMCDWDKKALRLTPFGMPLFEDYAASVTVDPKTFKSVYVNAVTFDDELVEKVGPVVPGKNGMKLAKTGFVTGTVKVTNSAGKAVSGKAYGVMVGETGYGTLVVKVDGTTTVVVGFKAVDPR